MADSSCRATVYPWPRAPRGPVPPCQPARAARAQWREVLPRAPPAGRRGGSVNRAQWRCGGSRDHVGGRVNGVRWWDFTVALRLRAWRVPSDSEVAAIRRAVPTDFLIVTHILPVNWHD